MMLDMVFTAQETKTLLILIPALAIGVTIFLYVLHQKLSKSGHVKALGWLIDPIPIRPIVQSRAYKEASGGTQQENLSMGKRIRKVLAQIGFRLLFFIILAAIVFTAMVLSLVFHEGGHGIFVEMVGATWTEIHIGLFYGSCYFFQTITPMAGQVYYLNQVVISVSGNLMEVIAGTAFLLLLLVPQIRKSFYASIFFLAMGVACTSSAFHSWYGESWNILYGTPSENSDTLNFLNFMAALSWNVTPEMILGWMTGFMAAIQFVIIFVVSKLWRGHYPRHRFSQIWLLVAIEILWWYHFLSRGYWFIPV
jgi:hypothetical protein